MNHSFNVEIAEKYGMEKAVLLENFYFWIKKNKANNKNLHEGRYYTYNTAEAFAELFPYIKERRIAQLLREMENEDNLLLSGQFFNYDRTKSYTLTDFALSFFEPSNIQNFDNGTYGNLTKEGTETGDCLNTDIKPDVKTTDINTNNGKKPKVDYQPIFNHYFENHKKLYEQGKLQTDKASIAYGKDNRLIEGLLETFSYDNILLVLDRAMADSFCVNNGYILSPILSASVFGRLLNAKNQTSKNFDKTTLEEKDFFA